MLVVCVKIKVRKVNFVFKRVRLGMNKHFLGTSAVYPAHSAKCTKNHRTVYNKITKRSTNISNLHKLSNQSLSIKLASKIARNSF